MPKLGVAATLVWAVLATGCGAGSEEQVVARTVKPADLELMVLPKRELGALASSLALDPDSSGPSGNGKAAKDTIDPRDTARALARAGRVRGYDLVFSARRRPSALGIVVLAQGVELFRTEHEASAYLKKQFADFRRFRGRTLAGVKLAHVESFDVELADQARGVNLRIVRPADGATVFATIVGFRRGRVVGAASLVLQRELVVPRDAERVADGIDDRIRGVTSGEIRTSSVQTIRKASASPDPEPLTLDAKQLRLRTRLNHQGYFRSRGVRAYLREYDVLGGRLAGSKIVYLRTMAQVFKNPSAAALNQRRLASAGGSTAVARGFVRALLRTDDLSALDLTVRPLRLDASDSAGLQFYFRAPNGRIEGVLLSVTRGRASASVLVMGFDHQVEPAAVLAAREQLRDRLRRTHRPS